jgi:hypothetical protein
MILSATLSMCVRVHGTVFRLHIGAVLSTLRAQFPRFYRYRPSRRTIAFIAHGLFFRANCISMR